MTFDTAQLSGFDARRRRYRSHAAAHAQPATTARPVAVDGTTLEPTSVDTYDRAARLVGYIPTLGLLYDWRITAETLSDDDLVAELLDDADEPLADVEP